MKEVDCYKEFPFVYQSNNEIVRGIMDIMANDDTTVYCVDFKTDRHLSEQELIDVYSSQLYDYRVALKLVYPNHTIRTGIYSFRYKKVIEID